MGSTIVFPPLPDYVTWDFIPMQNAINAAVTGFTVTIKNLNQTGGQWGIEFADNQSFNSAQQNQIISAIQGLSKPKFLN